MSKIRILIYTISGVLLVTIGLSIAAYFALTDESLANSNFAITLRRFYNFNLKQNIGEIKQIEPEIATLQVVHDKTDPSFVSYIYLVNGSFEKSVPETKTIYIKTDAGNVYGFVPEFTPQNEVYVWVPQAQGDPKILKVSFTEFNISVTKQFLDLSKTLTFQWEDTRPLRQIYEDLDHDPEKILNPKHVPSDFQRIILN